jgi:hypothetical protein
LTAFRRLAASFFILLTLALAGCGDTYEWNKKITVEVETPNGVKSGSSVQHIRWVSGTGYPGMDGPSADSKVTGEAVVVDLGGGKYLFALLSGTHGLKGASANIASFAFWGEDNAVGTAEGLRFLKSLPAGTKAELEPGNYPLLVTFADVNDPSTVQKADPESLAQIIAPGMALRSITLEMNIEEARVSRVHSVLEWLSENEEAALLKKLKPDDFSFAARRRHGEFIARQIKRQ